LSPKGTFVALSSKEIAFGDIRSPGTVRNLKLNPRIEVNFVDPLARRGFRVKGTSEIFGIETNEFKRLLTHFERWGRLSQRIKRIIQIRVSEAKLVETPAYDDGVTEDELRSIWSKTLLSSS
jgi:hypothetical protein